MTRILKTKKLSAIGEELFGVDPAGFTPAFLLVKGRVLLHKLQAQSPRKQIKTKEVLLQGPLL